MICEIEHKLFDFFVFYIDYGGGACYNFSIMEGVSMNDERSGILKISVFITSVFIIFLSITYAFMNQTVFGNKRQVLITGDLQIELEESKEITLENAMPMYDEVGKIQEQHFDFQVVNKTNYKVDYILHLKDITAEGKEKLNDSDVKYYLTKEHQDVKLEKLSDRVEDIIDEGEIRKDSTIHYSLRLWIDSEVITNEAIEGKTLSFQILVEVRKEAKEQYVVHYETGTDLTIEDEIKIEGTDYEITSIIPTKDNSTFLGWSTIEGGEPTYQAESLYTKDQDITLYAIWRLTHLYDNGNQYSDVTGGWTYTRTFNGESWGAYPGETYSFSPSYIEWNKTLTSAGNNFYYAAGYFEYRNAVNLNHAKSINIQYTVPLAVKDTGYPSATIYLLDSNNANIASKTINFTSANNNLTTFLLDVSDKDLSLCKVRISMNLAGYWGTQLKFRLYSVYATY